ncbi:bifunctional diaminohydroxyphosphoribosylaminopyrimidine deaminase/5-amino-6-(5-phosphoribosylamino)uracil reductase RibD [Candidatus Gottesmanbacteria bacterium]|nr:bifunctional diaminohydroxyphosphoribosylaminopyrimidine deaminase/5-amino-6-(5-phosphoribosylamino)uracil reductase RibD [Candidatus Gottesmanbacteria bacterium]
MNTNLKDHFFMKIALRLAKKGISWTNPHPMVGSVIVINGKIVARGYHRRFSTDHAEMEALKHATEGVGGATMYVTLEPCHLPYDLSGPRIPCVTIIRQAGIKKVHIAMLDSNPEVAGRGRIALEKAGIQTTLGLLQEEALHLNEAYHHFMTKGRPFVAATFSTSLDGKIATRTDDSKWITNQQARNYARSLRGRYQAILIGINTVLRDDPHLGIRVKGKKDPLRIILDSTLKIPSTSKVLRDTNVLIATTKKANKEKMKVLVDKGITVILFDEQGIPLSKLLKEFKKRKIISVLVEGGGSVLGSFLDERIIDKVYAFHSPILIGGEKAVSAIKGEGVVAINDALKLKNVTFKRFDDNLLTIGYTN